MGFFTDLKEDLSQAVSELLPEGESPEIAEADESEEMADLEEVMAEADDVAAAEQESDVLAADMPLKAAAGPEDSAEPWEDPAVFDDGLPIDIDEMLDKAEEMNIMKEVSEMMEESVYVAAAEAEMMKSDLPDKKVSDETATITAGMKLVGDVTSEGSLELEGVINGNIDILGKLNITGCIIGDSKAAEIFADNAKITGEMKSLGSVKIGQSTVIIGNIFANSAVIAGAVKGDIDVHGPVILDTSAIVMGNIKSKSVQINNGAVIEGMCSQCYAEVNPTSFFEEFKKGKK